MPMDRKKYPPDWEAISGRIRARAGNRCEECGVDNGTMGRRDRSGRWWTEVELTRASVSELIAAFAAVPNTLSRIVLTVAHVDHDTANNDESNLRCLCQYHHLLLDREQHAYNRAITRKRNAQDRAGSRARAERLSSL